MMKQPYNYWLEVPEGVGWDRKKSPEPNLHVCSEDDIKRVVYNGKESIEERIFWRKNQKQIYSEEKL